MGRYVKQEVDESAVIRLVRGERIRAQAIDYREAVRVLAGRGYHDGQIAHLLGRPRRSIQRTRGAMGVQPVIGRHDSARRGCRVRPGRGT